MAKPTATTDVDMRLQHFESVLSREPFKGLKVILDSVVARTSRGAVCAGVQDTNTYEELLARLGYRITVTRQIHVQDCWHADGAGRRHPRGAALL